MVLGGYKRTTIGSKLHVYRLPSEKENTIELSVAQGKSMEACNPKPKGVIPHMQKRQTFYFIPCLDLRLQAQYLTFFLSITKIYFKFLQNPALYQGLQEYCLE